MLPCSGSGDYPELVDLQAEVSKLKLDLEKVIIAITMCGNKYNACQAWAADTIAPAGVAK